MIKHTRFRAAGWVTTAGLVVVALAAPAATFASAPDRHQVTICHATNSDTNPYLQETVDVASSGHLQGGHDTQHTGPIWDATLKDQHISWGDIIPPYTYGDFAFAGMNWSTDGQSIWGNDCTIPQAVVTQPSGSPSASPSNPPSDAPSSSSPSADPSSTPSEQASSSPSADPSTSPSQPASSQDPSASPTDPGASPSTPPSVQPPSSPSSPSGDPTSSPVGQVLGATGVPQLTPPPTDIATTQPGTTGNSWQLILLAVAGILGSLLTLTPATARKRR